jgi:hypothetical protein
MPISSGIMFRMYRLGRLVALVYIRNAIAQDQGTGNRKAGKAGLPFLGGG